MGSWESLWPGMKTEVDRVNVPEFLN